VTVSFLYLMFILFLMSTVDVLEARIHEVVPRLANDLAWSLRSAFERGDEYRINNGELYEASQGFHVLQQLRLVEKVQTRPGMGTSIYRLKPQARELYDSLVAEGFYDKPTTE